jgi:hypothetical protein
LGNPIQEDEIGRVCDVWGRREMQTALAGKLDGKRLKKSRCR